MPSERRVTTQRSSGTLCKLDKVRRHKGCDNGAIGLRGRTAWKDWMRNETTCYPIYARRVQSLRKLHLCVASSPKQTYLH